MAIFTCKTLAQASGFLVAIFIFFKNTVAIIVCASVFCLSLLFLFYFKHQENIRIKEEKWFERVTENYLNTGFSPQPDIDKRTDWTEQQQYEAYERIIAANPKKKEGSKSNPYKPLNR